jgi:hypothetical protein
MNLRLSGFCILLMAILLPGFVTAVYSTELNVYGADSVTQSCINPYDSSCINHISEKSVAYGYTSGCPYDCLMNLRNAFTLMISRKDAALYQYL